uniref:DNA polymerase lambda n=1 Tax=Aurelia sp. 1 sensu Dawson et al. (2005) TaxID=237409 RepID=F7J5W9_9CNID|nr:DNA polymerase lambda [Aurelia sp. 1 sensu Dawson et al. (2005)]
MLLMMKGLVLCIPSYGMGQVRQKILSSLAREKGAVVVSVYQEDVTHVVLDAHLKPTNKTAITMLKRNAKLKSSSADGLQLKNGNNDSVIFVHADWLSQINKLNRLVPEQPYVLDMVPKRNENVEEEEKHPKRQKVEVESVVGKDEASESNVPTTFACMKRSLLKVNCEESPEEGSNEFIIEKLKVLLEEYTALGDKWRVMGYKKAITALSKCKEIIRSTEQARKLPHVGERLAEKIGEIAETRRLRRLDYVDNRVETLKAFCDIHGVGPVVAADLYAKGFRSIEELRTYSDTPESCGPSAKVTLSRPQRIGLKHVEDFRQRIPREEVSVIAGLVREVCHRFINEE